MIPFFGRLSVRAEIRTMLAIFIACIAATSLIDLYATRDALLKEKEAKTRSLVESAYGVLVHFRDQQARGLLPEDAAKAAAMNAVRAMRYDGREYFWLNGLATPYPKMVMHPTVPDLDGKVLDGAEGLYQSVEGLSARIVALLDASARKA